MLGLLHSLLRFVLLSALIGCGVVTFSVWLTDVHWSFDLAAQFLLPSIIVACGVAVIAGLAQLTGIGAGALAIAIIASIYAGPWSKPANPTVTKTSTFSVLLFNVWYKNSDLDKIEKLIRSKNPDLLVLLEATPRIRDGVSKALQSYPYHLDCLDVARCGFLVASRARLQPKDIKVGGSASMVLNANLAGCETTLILAHLTRPFPFDHAQAQREQAARLGSEAAAWQRTKLMLGDFNAAPWGHVMQTIATRGRMQLLTGSGGTWPVQLPKQMRIPIDHMLASPGLSFIKREVLDAAGSDHAPVYAEIAVTNPTLCGSQ